MSKFVLATLLLALFILSPSILQLGQAQSPSAAPVPPPNFCDTKCEERCSKAGEKKRCWRYCGICCQQCHCVPSGTFGNKSECPCYRDKLNTKGTSKCP